MRQLALFSSLMSLFLAGAPRLLAQPSSYQIIDLGPREIGVPGYQNFSLGVFAGPASLNNNHQAVVSMFNAGGISPNPVAGFDSPFAGGTRPVALWERGFLRDLRWSTPGFPILNPQYGFNGNGDSPSIGSNGDVASQCEQSNFGDVSAAFPHIQAGERCLQRWAVRYAASTRTWQRIGRLAADPFSLGLNSTASGINGSGLVVGTSTRPAGDNTYNDAPCSVTDEGNRPRAFTFNGAFTRLTPKPNLPQFNISNQCVGSISESRAAAVNDSGLVVGGVLNNFGTGLPYCDPAVYPNLDRLLFLPQVWTAGVATNPFDGGLGGLPGNRCTMEGSLFAVSSNGNYGGQWRLVALPSNPYKPFVAVNGQFVDIPIPAQASGQVNGVNASGDAVGFYSLNGVMVPFLYHRASNQVIDLRTRIPANPTGIPHSNVVPLTATAINDSGSILVNVSVPLSQFSSIGRVYMLKEQPFCQAAINITSAPVSTPQAGVNRTVFFNLKQSTGDCRIHPLGRVEAQVNGSPAGLGREIQGFSAAEGFDTTAGLDSSVEVPFTAGSNSLALSYSGNGLFASALSPSVNVTSGPACLSVPSTLPVRLLGFTYLPGVIQQTVQITNNTAETLSGSLALTVRNVSPGATLQFSNTIQNCATPQNPAGTPYVAFSVDGLAPGARRNVTLRFSVAAPQPVTFQYTLLKPEGQL